MMINKLNPDAEIGFDIPAVPGMAESEVQTPCLIVDLDRLEYNLKKMADLIAPFNVSLRAHAKMHKSVDVALLQLTVGQANGICCQKVSEAEVFFRAGITDILITNQVCDARKISRLVGLAASGCRISVCVDDMRNVAMLSEEARKQNTQIHCLVELDCGAGRCGVSDAAQVLELAAAIDAAHCLVFEGLQAYQGSIQHETDYGLREKVMEDVIAKVKDCRDTLAAAELSCRVVSGGGTGTFLFEAASGVFTEVQCGSYAFMDADYGRVHNQEGSRLDQSEWENALFLLTSVMSTALDGHAVCDAGLKVQSVDSGLPVIFGHDDISYITCSDEHGVIRDKQNKLKINDKLRLVPGHCDPTCNLHDWYVCVRDGKVEALWPVSARGKAW
ncbi:MAG: DSD1 family PLP-dependent enzyme [Burkholderiales bacterium]